MALKSINPFTNEIIKEYEEDNMQQIQDKLENASNAFAEWKFSDFKTRATNMVNITNILKANKEKYARLMTDEMGKPITESQAEIEKCSWVCSYYADNAPDFLQNENIETDAKHSYVSYDPLGTILAIMPWNFPFWQLFRFAAPALMAGNVALLKHASNVQGCSQAIRDIMHEAGYPDGVFQSLMISSGEVSKIIDDERIAAITLTGSEFAGAKVAETAGRNIKKTVLELGGNNAFIVLDDADIDKAVDIGVKARMQNGGQSCIAAKRFIIHEKVYDQYLERFVSKMKKIIPGDPASAETQLGPLASVDQAELVEKQVKDSVHKGAKLILGGQRDRALFEPTVIENMKPGMPVFDEEVFGPVASFLKTSNDLDCVKISNMSKYGLGATIFTSNTDRARKMIPHFQDGSVFINQLVKSDPRLPFGGTKKSGFGRELSHHGIKEFVNTKTVYIQ